MLKSSNLPGIIGGVIILLLGWMAAAWISRGISRKMRLCGHEGEPCECGRAGAIIARVVYYLLLLVVLAWALAVMRVDFAAGTLRDFLTTLAGYLPNLAGAVILAVIAWVISGLARNITRKILTGWHTDEKLAEHTGKTGLCNAPEKASQVVYYIVYLFFVPAILDALRIHGITEPLGRMFEKILLYLPNVLAAAVVILVAVIFGRIIANICAKAASALGFDRFTGKALGREFKENTPSVILGKIVFLAVMVFAVLVACEALGLLKLAELISLFTVFGGNLLLSAIVLLIGFRLAEFTAEMLKDKCSAAVINILRAAIIFFTVALALSNLDRRTGGDDRFRFDPRHGVSGGGDRIRHWRQGSRRPVPGGAGQTP
jgi:hypothetical protein